MPIDIASGILSLDYEDVSIPGKQSLVWNRRYSTSLLQAPDASPLGPGWRNRYDATLSLNDGVYHFGTPSGAVETFDDPEGIVARGGVVRNLGASLELFAHESMFYVQSWNVETHEVVRYGFQAVRSQSPWKLRTIEDVSGQGLDIGWTDDGRLQAVAQRLEGRELRFDYDKGGRLSSVKLAAAGCTFAIAQYVHDGDGRLVEAIDALGYSDRFEYDTAGRMVREVQKDGGVFNARFDDKGRCVRRSGLGRYNERTLRFIDGARITEVKDSLGRTFIYHHLPSGQATTIVDATGGQSSTRYDEHGRIVCIRGPGGGETRFTYDESGNRDSIRDAAGGVTRFTFNDHHRPLSKVDACGHVWQRRYDERQRLTSTEDPDGNCWSFCYDDEGTVSEVVNPAGGKRFENHRQGVLQSITDWNGATTHYRFDPFGRVEQRTGPTGAKTQFKYDRKGNLVQTRLPDGSHVQASYDAAGNLTCFVDGNGRTTRWRYGPCGRILERTDPTGYRTRYAWDTEPALLLEIVNEANEVFRFVHDECGRVEEEIGFDGAARRYRYDADGQVIEYTNANDETIRLRRDAVHRIVEILAPDEAPVQYRYDALGSLVEACNSLTTVRFERDSVGRIVKECQGDHWVRSEYDRLGNLVRTESDLGHLCEYRTDTAGMMVSLTAGSLRKSMTFGRDNEGRETRRSMPSGALMEQQYDLMGRLARQLVREGPAAPWDSRSKSSLALVERSFAYDRSGFVSRVDDARWGWTEFSCDPADRIIQTLRERGATERFEFGPTGSMSRVRIERQVVDDQACSYSAGNRLVAKGGTRFEYDREGRRTAKIELAGEPTSRQWTYCWHATGRLREIRLPDGSAWHYSYDALGRRFRKEEVSPQGSQVRSVSFVWDKDVVLHEIDAERTSSWIHEPNTFIPVATVQQGQLCSVIVDQAGLPREIIDESGRVCWSRPSTVMGAEAQTSDEPKGITCPVSFQGQWRDTETGLHYNFHRYYDPDTASFISPDPIRLLGGKNLYLPVPNTSRWIDPLGLCPNDPIKENEVTTFEDFVKRSTVGDNLEGHEMLQHAILKENGLATARLSTDASKQNPVIALDHDTHVAVNRAQLEQGTATMPPRESIAANAQILKDNGVPARTVNKMENQAVTHAKTLGLI